MPHLSLLTAVLVACVAVSGCGGDGGGEPCDPLAAEIVPLELGTIVGVGRDADGKLYVVDRTASSDELRVLESEGDYLFLRRVAGTGSIHTGGSEVHILTVESQAVGYSLIVQLDGGEVRMARTMQPDPRLMSVDEAAPEEVLEIVGAEALDALTPRDYVTEVQFEYVARTPSDELLVVVSGGSDVDDYYGSFRLFFGAEGELMERELSDVVRGRDGGSTHLLFDLDGEAADAFFPVMLGAMGAIPQPATLEVDGRTVPLERIDHLGALADARFSCL